MKWYFPCLEISPRGKRRLEFQHEKHQEPLKDCTFYLDLENYRKTGSLKARIKELGGVREDFNSTACKIPVRATAL